MGALRSERLSFEATLRSARAMKIMMGRHTASVVIALLFTISLTMPQALADPSVASPQVTPNGHHLRLDSFAGRPGNIGAQVAAASSSSQGACFGYNNVNDSLIPTIIKSLRIAVIQPVLTSTPYSQYNTGSFYAFYAKEQGVHTNVTTNLNLLSTSVSSGYGFYQGWGLSHGMYEFLTSQTAVNCGLEVGKNVQVLTDMNVSQGALFGAQNQAARFDVVILPFSEYVTVQEYAAYENFVAGGGTLVMMAHSLEYPVAFDPATNLETLVYGHGWAFNGKYAYPIACASNTYVFTCPWAKNNTNWTGSNTCMSSCFHTYKFNGSVVKQRDPLGRALYNEFGGAVFKSYLSHEENTVTNMTGTSIASVFVNDSTNLIAAYTHQFRKGTVVCMGIFGDDIIAIDRSAQYFLLLGTTYGRLSSPPILTTSSTVLPSTTTTSKSSTSSTASTSSMSSSSVSTSSTTFATSPTSERSSSTSTVSVPQSQGTLPTTLITLGGLAGIVIVASLVLLRRRQARPGA